MALLGCCGADTQQSPELENHNFILGLNAIAEKSPFGKQKHVFTPLLSDSEIFLTSSMVGIPIRYDK